MALADLPLKRALGVNQYKAPPPGARSAARGSAMPSLGTQATVVDAATGEEFSSYEGVAETASSGFEGVSDFSSGVVPPPVEGDDAPPFNADSEASALADARARGEDVLSAALNTAEDEASRKKLPSLTEVLPAIPTAIQEAIDEIFRAKWVRVARVKKKDLFTP